MFHSKTQAALIRKTCRFTDLLEDISVNWEAGSMSKRKKLRQEHFNFSKRCFRYIHTCDGQSANCSYRRLTNYSDGNVSKFVLKGNMNGQVSLLVKDINNY